MIFLLSFRGCTVLLLKSYNRTIFTYVLIQFVKQFEIRMVEYTVCCNQDGLMDCVLQSGWWRIVCCNPDGGGLFAALQMVEDCVLQSGW